MSRSTFDYLAITFCLGCTVALAQTERKNFEVATIKQSSINDNRFMFRGLPGGALTVVGVPLKMLIMMAYDVKAFQISSGPSWIATQRWDIEAKAEGVQGQVPMAQLRPMLQGLIAERFRLSLHRETKKMPVFALIVAKNGPKLTPHVGNPAQPGQRIRPGPGSLTVQQGNMAILAAQLSQQLWRAVIDKTGLQQEYDFTLKWTPESGQGGPESIGLPPESSAPPRPDLNGPSIFTAVQEQLGLRLDSQKGPVEIIVIDHVEYPSEN